MSIFQRLAKSRSIGKYTPLNDIATPIPAFARAAQPTQLYVKEQNGARDGLDFMTEISVADILELPLQDRIQLVEVIWESIATTLNAIEVSPALKTELQARLADFERDPEAGYSWDQVKAHSKSGSWRTA